MGEPIGLRNVTDVKLILLVSRLNNKKTRQSVLKTQYSSSTLSLGWPQHHLCLSGMKYLSSLCTIRKIMTCMKVNANEISMTWMFYVCSKQNEKPVKIYCEMDVFFASDNGDIDNNVCWLDALKLSWKATFETVNGCVDTLCQTTATLLLLMASSPLLWKAYVIAKMGTQWGTVCPKSTCLLLWSFF